MVTLQTVRFFYNWFRFISNVCKEGDYVTENYLYTIGRK